MLNLGPKTGTKLINLLEFKVKDFGLFPSPVSIQNTNVHVQSQSLFSSIKFFVCHIYLIFNISAAHLMTNGILNDVKIIFES